MSWLEPSLSRAVGCKRLQRGGQIILEKRERLLYELQLNQKANEEALDISKTLINPKDRPRIADNELLRALAVGRH